jgi:very-short-patch-repair endonuclease
VTAFDPLTVRRRLGEFRQNLLDPSLRNRLINFRTHTKAGKPLEKVIEVYGEDPIELMRILVTDGRSMSFTGRPDPRPIKDPVAQPALHDYGDADSLERLRQEAENELDLYLQIGREVADATDLKLSTREAASILQRKLTKIARDATTATEEQGVNVLFLALGSLLWYESDNSDEVRRSPLVLLPVALDRTRAGAFRLKWDGTEPGSNLSIEAKLKAEFGIRLPGLPDEPDLRSYFDRVEQSTVSQDRWSLDRTSVALAFFSYAKYLMYRDLDPSLWPAEHQPKNHEVLGALLDQGFGENEAGIGEETFLDPLRPAANVCEVYDADSSQALAILEANTGRSMIIEGPPGTGKSQTITNLIAEAIGAGKKVLFVAEKAAALDVVYRKLCAANLEDACLELHSHKANKRGFYAELKRTVAMAAPVTEQLQSTILKLDADRSRLNDYTESVNLVLSPFDISPRYAIGKLMALGPEPAPEGRHNFDFMETWSESGFLERLDLVRRIESQLALTGRPIDHPFFGCKLDHLLPQDKEDILSQLNEASKAMERFEESANALANLLKVEAPVCPVDIEQLSKCVDFIADSPDTQDISILGNWETAEPTVRNAIAAGNSLKQMMERMGDEIAPGAIEQDLSGLRNALRLEGLADENIKELDAVELSGVLASLEAARNQTLALVNAAQDLARQLGVLTPKRFREMEPLAALAAQLGTAPDLRGIAVSSSKWRDSGTIVRESIGLVKRHADLRSQFKGVLSDSAWTAEVRNDLSVLDAESANLFRIFKSQFRQTMVSSAAYFHSPPKSVHERIGALKAVVESAEIESRLAERRGRLSILFGPRWEGVQSDSRALLEAASWIEEAHEEGRIPIEALTALERGVKPADLAHAAGDLRAQCDASSRSIGTLHGALAGAGLSADFGDNVDGIERVMEYILTTLQSSVQELRKIIPKSEEIGFCSALGLLDELNAAQIAREQIRSASGVCVPLGIDWKAEQTDWRPVEIQLNWILEFRRLVSQGQLPEGLTLFFHEKCPRTGLAAAVLQARDDRKASEGALRSVLLLIRIDLDPKSLSDTPITDQKKQIDHWIARLDDLADLIRYNSVVDLADGLGLSESIALANSWPSAKDRLSEAFERSWYTGVIRKAIKSRPALAQFDRMEHEEILREFRALDDLALRYNRTKVALAHWRSVPRGIAGGAMSWLGVQFNLRSHGHKPVRTTMENAGEAVQAIKPVFLMSPLSIAMYLPATGPRFDLVIFDEASQVKPEDAFGAILRGKQTIVVGDSEQMPPTSFFDNLTREGVENEEDEAVDEYGGAMKELESLLAMMSAKLPAQTPRRRDLRWHYRSRHEDLIATSNRLFYKDRLIVFPSSWRRNAGTGLILRHDPKTIYSRGNTRKNVGEARAVAMAARNHILQHPNLTLGIAAFSKPQQEAIQDELDLLRKDEPAFAAFDAEHEFERLFVKNLENIQGDERDVIFISIGYGRDESGSISASFGPLNRDGGERRLNVLISRARIRCEVFTSLRAADVRLTETPSRGVLALKTFLAFADTGNLDVPSASVMDLPSPLEVAVLERLRSHGYDVESQVGTSSFYIDIAVHHPEERARFVIGIECDGAMYRRARSARDRDKLRMRALESRGWQLHRIWSWDWFQNEEAEFKRLVEAIENAGRESEVDVLQSVPLASDYVPLERTDDVSITTGIYPYTFCELRIDLLGTPLHLMPTHQIAAWVHEVVSEESPVHLEEVVRRIREAAGLGQAGNRIRAAIEGAVEACEHDKQIIRKGDFLYWNNHSPIRVRSRAGLPAASRRIENVSPEEIIEAAAKVIRGSFGIKLDETVGLTARSLGFERTTVAMSAWIESLIEEAIGQGRFIVEGDLLKVASRGISAF